MARRADDTVLDAPFDIINNATIMTVCSQEPANRSEAVTTYALADAVPTFGAPADGSPSGRQMSVEQKSNVPIDASGDATHIALCDGTTLLYVTVCNTQTLTSGGTVTIPAWLITFLDPAAP